MKKLFIPVLFVALLAAFYVSPALAQPTVPISDESVHIQQEEPPASDLVLPVGLEDLIKVAFGLLVTQGLKSLSKVMKKDISGWAAVITAGLATSVIYFANAMLSTVPEPAQASVAATLGLVVTILSAFGLKDMLKSKASNVEIKY